MYLLINNLKQSITSLKSSYLISHEQDSYIIPTIMAAKRWSTPTLSLMVGQPLTKRHHLECCILIGRAVKD